MPTLRELAELEQKKQEDAKKKALEAMKAREAEKQRKREEEANIKRVEKPIPSPSRKEMKVKAEGWDPTSDHIRTAYYLLTGRSSRGRKEEILRELPHILDQLEAREQSKLALLSKE